MNIHDEHYYVLVRTAMVCQNGHHRWLYHLISRGDVRTLWEPQECDCPTGEIGEGFVASAPSQVVLEEHKKYDATARFDFPVDMDGEEVEEWLSLAIADAEITLGHSKVRQELQYKTLVDSRSRMLYPHAVEIDVSNETGKHIAKIFGELVERAASAKRYLEKMGKR